MAKGILPQPGRQRAWKAKASIPEGNMLETENIVTASLGHCPSKVHKRRGKKVLSSATYAEPSRTLFRHLLKCSPSFQGRPKFLIDMKYLRQVFHLPFEKACEQLGIGTTTLKRICREKSIRRWPYRGLKSASKKTMTINSNGQVPGCFEDMVGQVVTQGDALGETLTPGFCSTGMSGLVQNVTALSGEVIQTNSGEAGTFEKLQGTHCSGILSLTCDLSVSNLDDTDDILRMFEEAVAGGRTSCRA